MAHLNTKKVTTAGLLVTLGIIFGDIGTSPLYVMKSILGKSPINEVLVYGGISCVFWTLTIQTTFKYIFLTLRADNHGEGGIFSLYALVRKMSKSLIVFAIIGGATLLADGIITPPISVSSAIEGLHQIKGFEHIQTVPIVLIIITIIFAFQQFGTTVVGKAFGPIMFIWFSMLGILGLSQIIAHPEVFKALNPMYAWQLLTATPEGFWLLGAVFLCTTGAEALYSDLGHCGRGNIRVSWIFVKVCLILNYFGQGAWLMAHEGRVLDSLKENPFYMIMPEWFVLIGIFIATLAAIIASQALISGSFTLIGEAVRLNLFPKIRVVFPTLEKGQLYIPMVNTGLWLGCLGIVLYFKESSHMEAAYGLAITITMLMTTILLTYYLRLKKFNPILVYSIFALFVTIEGGFLIANLVKFTHGGYVTVIVASGIAFLMWVWVRAKSIRTKLTDYVKVEGYLDQLQELSLDESLPKYATNLVFLSKAKRNDEVEETIMYSILQKFPKRADVYWFVYIETTDEPDTMEYEVKVHAAEDVVRVHFRLGFRVPQRVSMFLRKVIEDMVAKDEIHIGSRYHSLKEQNKVGDFRFIVLDEVLAVDNDLPFIEKMVLSIYYGLRRFTADPVKWFGLDTSMVEVEKVPLFVARRQAINLKRLNG